MQTLGLWLSDPMVWLKLIGIGLLVYAVYALYRMTKDKDENATLFHVMIGGTSLAMGLLVFGLGVLAVFIGDV